VFDVGILPQFLRNRLKESGINFGVVGQAVFWLSRTMNLKLKHRQGSSPGASPVFVISACLYPF
jgi:hypothetical protein